MILHDQKLNFIWMMKDDCRIALVGNRLLLKYMSAVSYLKEYNVLQYCTAFENEPEHNKTNRMTVCPAKTQISLGICPVWSESLLCTVWVAKDRLGGCPGWSEYSLCTLCAQVIMPPTSKKLRGHIGLGLSVHPSVTYGYGHEPLEIGSWKCVYRTCMKNKGTHIFFSFFSVRLVVAELFPSFNLRSVNLWNLVNKTSRERLS